MEVDGTCEASGWPRNAERGSRRARSRAASHEVGRMAAKTGGAAGMAWLLLRRRSGYGATAMRSPGSRVLPTIGKSGMYVVSEWSRWLRE